MRRRNHKARFAICINNSGYADDLKVRTVYQVLSDESAAKSNYLRIIDETGEDYLYPAAYFILIDVPGAVEKALRLVDSAKTAQKRTKKRTIRKQKVRA